MIRRLRQFRRDQRGAYLLEMGLVLPLFLMLVMGIFDLGMTTYYRAVLQGVVEKTARKGTMENNFSNSSTMDTAITNQMMQLNRTATMTYSRTAYTGYEDITRPEDFTDNNRDGTLGPGECFQDANANGTWDTDRGRDGQGSANDVVEYTVNMQYKRLFPLWKMLGQSQTASIEVKTLLRNQPFANQTNPTVVVCIPIPVT